jgi:FkbM family methyltransferase
MSKGLENGLNVLKENGFTPNKILDIGANIGEFTMICKNIWPGSKSTMIEANKKCESTLEGLNETYFIELLGENDDDEITFYLTKDNELCTGNSVYLEKTEHYSEERVIEEKRKTKKLDTMFSDESFDLIKIDTQGSELDILKGGTELIKESKYILIETSVKEYNIGAPLEDEIIKFMEDNGYGNYDVLDTHTWPVEHGPFNEGEIFQRDILFYK